MLRTPPCFPIHDREWPKEHVDHINGDTSDNRWVNMREATNSENMQNLRGPRRDNKTGVLGTCWDKARSKWVAVIQVKGKQRNLGRFDSQDEAAAAYLKAKRELHPFSTL